MRLLLALLVSVLPLLAAEKDSATDKPAAAKDPTAFDLAKEGNKYVGEQAKDKIVQIRSERSVGSLTPRVWYVIYFDPTATFKSVEVKFAGGKMIDVKRPFRMIEMIGDASKSIDHDKLKIDSDVAIEKVIAEPILKDIKVKSVEAKLENTAGGPVWRIKLWAEKINGRDVADIGRFTVTADDGKVTETDVHLDRLG
jgi:hypothetical protein